MYILLLESTTQPVGLKNLAGVGFVTPAILTLPITNPNCPTVPAYVNALY